MIDYTKDGITHINIYSRGGTELGRMLSNFYHYKVQTVDGEFNSVEGYWHWLGLENCKEKEELKNLYGYMAKKTGDALKAHFNSRFDADFERKILNAIWYKVQRNTRLFVPEISKLPLEHYYNFNGRIMDVKNKYLWMINGIDKMRNYIIEKGYGL